MHPKLVEHLEALGIDPTHGVNPAQWKALSAVIGAEYEEATRQEFLLGQTLDTMERSSRLLEQEATDERDRLRALVESIDDGVVVVERMGRATGVNEVGTAMLSGRRGLAGALELSLPEAEGLDDRGFAHLVVEGAVRDDDAWWVMPDGQRIPVSCVLSPVRDGDFVRRLVCVVRDISSQKSTERSLRRLNEELTEARDAAVDASAAKSRFLANISHELRTPLNAVIGYTELIREELTHHGSAEPVSADLDRVLVSAHHLLELINELLDLSKIEAGRVRLDWQDFEVRELLDEVAAAVRPVIERSENTFEVQYAEELGAIRADRVRLKQILGNLLSNAAKFTDEGIVRLESWREQTEYGELLWFAVEDDGIGMDDATQAMLFEPFVQGEGQGERLTEGTGLGLTITRHFSRMMGGDVEVQSTLGQGSSFKVWLPALTQQGAQEILDELEDDTEHHGLVLLIEDDPMTRDLVRRQLAGTGFRIVHAADGEEGLMMARTVRPDVIVLDVLLPKLDGWQVLTRLRADDELSDIPIVMSSILSDQQELSRGFALGADGYLVKPVSREQLVQTLVHAGARHEGAGATPKALVVDDSEAVREILETQLTSQGWSVRTAEHGMAALGALRKDIPDVILLDLLMPEMDGFTFLSELRSEPKYADVHVVVLTAKSLDVGEREMLETSVSQVMEKASFLQASFIDEIKSLVRRGSKAQGARTTPEGGQ